MGEKKEYIERVALIRFVKQNTPNIHGDTTMRCVERALKAAPAADVEEVRHGHWIIKTDEYGNEYMMCSCCKDEFYPVDADTVDSTPNYCQTCGAKMDGERKENT